MNTGTRTCFGCGAFLPFQAHPTFTAHEFKCALEHPDKVPPAMKILVEREKARQERSRIARLAAQKRQDARKAKLNPPTWCYLWNQITDKIVQWEGDPKVHWPYHSLLPNGTAVMYDGVQSAYALETWATDEQHAHRKFLAFPPYEKLHQ